MAASKVEKANKVSESLDRGRRRPLGARWERSWLGLGAGHVRSDAEERSR